MSELTTEAISVHFQGLRALDSVDLSLKDGDILGLLGPNGAGKTTLVNVVSGFQKPTAGTVRVDGKSVGGLTPNALARHGIARTFQSVRLFRRLSVLENVEVAALAHAKSVREARSTARRALEFVGLGDAASSIAGELPYADERRVGVARALALKPRFLLLDEPAAGMTDSECLELVGIIRQLPHSFGCAVLLIEHNIGVVMEVCDRLHVLNGGRTLAVGGVESVRKNPEVIAAYFGEAREVLLSVASLQVRYGKAPAIHELSLHVAAGEIVCLVGPNGAGKSTCLLTIAGVVEPARGEIEFEGRSIRGLSPETIARAGISLVPEGRRIFGRLTVRENLVVASGTQGGVLKTRDQFDRVLALFPVLQDRYNGYAGQLSGGEQQQLAIARALICRPKLLLVDEPSLGLAPLFADLVFETLKRLREEGVTLLVVEQSAKRALDLADRTYLLRSGRLILEGPSAALASNPEFEHAYFGGSTAGMNILQLVVDAASLGSQYALVALGIGLVFGVMRMINFAHGDLIMLGAYALVVPTAADFAAPLIGGWPFPLMILGILFVVTFVALATERFAFRPLRKRGASGPTLLISSFAVSYLIQSLVLFIHTGRPKSVSIFSSLTQQVTVGGVRISLIDIVTIAVTLLLLLALSLFLRRTRAGIEVQAASEDFIMARMLGVRADRAIALAFGLSGILAAAVSLLYVAKTGVLDFRMGVPLAIAGFVGTVIGGMGSLPGAVLGGFFLGAASMLLQSLLPPELRPARDAFVYGLVIVVLLFRPQGLFVAGEAGERI